MFGIVGCEEINSLNNLMVPRLPYFRCPAGQLYGFGFKPGTRDGYLAWIA